MINFHSKFCFLSFNGWRHSLCVLSHVQLSVTPWTVACSAPLSMGFSRQDYWSGLPFPPPGDLLTWGSNTRLLLWQADSLPLEQPGKPKAKPLTINYQPHWHVLILFTEFKISLRSDSRNWNKLTGQMPKSILILCSLKISVTFASEKDKINKCVNGKYFHGW